MALAPALPGHAQLYQQAKGERYGLRAVVYEFNQGAVLKGFSKASLAGADVKIIFDTRENTENTPNKSNREAIAAAGIDAFSILPSDVRHRSKIV